MQKEDVDTCGSWRTEHRYHRSHRLHHPSSIPGITHRALDL